MPDQCLVQVAQAPPTSKELGRAPVYQSRGKLCRRLPGGPRGQQLTATACSKHWHRVEGRSSLRSTDGSEGQRPGWTAESRVRDSRGDLDRAGVQGHELSHIPVGVWSPLPFEESTSPSSKKAFLCILRYGLSSLCSTILTYLLMACPLCCLPPIPIATNEDDNDYYYTGPNCREKTHCSSRQVIFHNTPVVLLAGIIFSIA